jgi:MFS family permease
MSSPRARVPGALAVVIGGMFVSFVGDSVASLGLILDAAGKGLAWGVTAVFLAELLPPLLLAPVLGVLVDRWDARTVWVLASLVQATAFALAAAADAFLIRVALVALASVFAVASSAAAFKLLPTVAGRVGVERANGAVSAAVSLAGLVGPSVGGAAFSVAGPTMLLLADAGSFVAVTIAVAVVVPAGSGQRMRLDGHPLAGAIRGLRVLRGSPLIGAMLPTLAGVICATSIEGVAGVFYLREVAGGDRGYGLLLAAWALGSIPGAMVAGAPRIARHDARLVLGGAALIAVSLLVEGLVPVTVVIAVAFVLGGFGNGLHNVGVRTTIHRHVAADAHGRAWATYTALANLCVTVGYLLGTPTGLVGSRSVIVISGTLALTVTVVSALLLRQLLFGFGHRARQTIQAVEPAPTPSASSDQPR